jgi:hypothetical protein
VQLLRRLPTIRNEFDPEHIAEEIEDISGSTNLPIIGSMRSLSGAPS